MRRRLAIVAAALFTGAGLLAAQSSQLSGTVRDESGAVLPGVTVKLESQVLEKTRTTTTDAKGTYTFRDLPADDRYVVSFSLVCFRSDPRRNVAIAEDNKTTVDGVMRIGTCDNRDRSSSFRIIPILAQ